MTIQSSDPSVQIPAGRGQSLPFLKHCKSRPAKFWPTSATLLPLPTHCLVTTPLFATSGFNCFTVTAQSSSVLSTVATLIHQCSCLGKENCLISELSDTNQLKTCSSGRNRCHSIRLALGGELWRQGPGSCCLSFQLTCTAQHCLRALCCFMCKSANRASSRTQSSTRTTVIGATSAFWLKKVRLPTGPLPRRVSRKVDCMKSLSSELHRTISYRSLLSCVRPPYKHSMSLPRNSYIVLGYLSGMLQETAMDIKNDSLKTNLI